MNQKLNCCKQLLSGLLSVECHSLLWKLIKTCYIIVCASIIEDDNVGRDVCPWMLHASVPKNLGGYFKIKFYVGEHTCSQPSLRSNYRKTFSSFVCNVILPIVRKKFDMSLGYIIKYIEAKYHINITLQVVEF